MLQQHLPFTVLKHGIAIARHFKRFDELQQHLPFTVLKLTPPFLPLTSFSQGCNSTYRLRY